jgi:lipoate synthase
MINFNEAKVCILSENTNGCAPHNHYRNLGASEVTRRLAKRNIPCTTIEWFSHWDTSDLYFCIYNYLKDAKTPIIAISVPFLADDVYLIKDILEKLKSSLPALKIILGGNRTYDNNFDTFVDYYFIGRSMEIFENWLDNKDMTCFQTAISNVFINNNIKAENELPVLAFYKDEDFLTEHDIVGFELGIGCRFNCSFCNYDLRNMKNPKIANAEHIANTLQNLYNKYGIRNFFLTDDTINESIEKLETLAEIVRRLSFKPNLAGYFRLDLLSQERQQQLWKEIDMAAVFFGIESFNSTASKRVRKSGRIVSQIETLKKLRTLTPNTFLSAGMIVGLSGDSRDDIFKSIRYVHENNLLDAMQYSALNMPAMDTDIFDDYMLSDFSKNPTKFGYKILSKKSRPGRSVQSLYDWQNEWCTFEEAMVLQEEVNNYLKVLKISSSDAFEYLSFLSLQLAEHKEIIKAMNQLAITKSLQKANRLRQEYIVKKIDSLKQLFDNQQTTKGKL